MIDKLAYIEIQNKKILMTLSRGKDTWYIPGGKREGNETDHEALCREIREELGVELVSETFQYYGTFKAQAHGKPEGVLVQMTCYTGSYDGNLMASGEIEKIDWLDYSQKNSLGPVDQIIFNDLKKNRLID